MKIYWHLLHLVSLGAAAQNVGIGINPTKAKLEVAGAVGNTVAMFSGNGFGISVQQNWPAIGFNHYYNGNNLSMNAGFAMVWHLDMNNGSLAIDMGGPAVNANSLLAPDRKLTIQQNGNVGVYTTSASASLFVNASSLGIPAVVFKGTQHSSIFYEQGVVGNPNRNTRINAGKTGSVVLLNDAPGGNVLIGSGTSRVGINTTIPAAMIDIKQYNGRGLALINSSFAYWQLFSEKNLTEPGSDFYVYYGGSNLGNFFHLDGLYYNYSDQRVKEHIEPMGRVTELAMQLQPKRYVVKHGNPGRVQSIGLLAQDVKKQFPQMVSVMEGTEHGYEGITDLHSMDYTALNPVVLKSIQEQQEYIKLLSKRIDGLRNAITAAEQKIKDNRN